MSTTAPELRLPSLPEPRAGGLLRALLVVAVAAGVTAFWLHETRIERWLASLSTFDDGSYQSYRRHYVLDWLDAEGDPDDPRIAAAFVQEIVNGAAAVTPPRSERYEAGRSLAVAAEVLARRKPAVSEAYLAALLTLYGTLEDTNCVELVRQLGPDAHQQLREVGARIEDPVARFAAVLLGCAVGAGRPEDVDAILAGVEFGNPPPDEAELVAAALARENDRGGAAIDAEFAGDERHVAARLALLGFGDSIVDRLVIGFQSRSRAVTNLCARVLRETSLATLIAETEKRIDEYAEAGLRRSAAENVVFRAEYFRSHPDEVPEVEAGQPSPVPDEEQLARARAMLGQDQHLSNLVAESLQALLDVRGDERVDLCFMRALSSPNEAVAKFCARELRRRLTRQQFADALFRFLSHKGSFWVREIDVYEGALQGYGVEVSADIARNLEALLAAADGDAEQVFWIHKAIALRSLEKVGEPGAFEVLRRYAVDPGSYVLSSTDRRTGESTEEEISFHDLAVKAAAAIAARSGVAGPALPPRPAAPADK